MIITKRQIRNIFFEFNKFKEYMYAGKTKEERDELAQFFTPPEISIKLLEMYPTISFIVASIKDENIRSKKAAFNAGYTYFEGNQYHFNRR